MSHNSNTTYTTLQNVLIVGATLHAFRSGGGLRVVRVDEPGHGLVGYGEHPHATEALQMAEEDIRNGQLVYNPDPPEPHYLTGSSKAEGALDAWLLDGNTLDVDHVGTFRAKLKGYSHTEVPLDVRQGASNGRTTLWEDARGYFFVTKPMRFPNGYLGGTTGVYSEPEDTGDAWSWESVRVGLAPTLAGALDSAFSACPSTYRR